MGDGIEDRYLMALRKLRRRVTLLEEMVRWRDDLASRLWRAECVLRATGECLYDAHELEQEVKHYAEIVRRLRQMKEDADA